jgi:hypothetical protein
MTPAELQLATQITGYGVFLFVWLPPERVDEALVAALEALGDGLENMHDAEGQPSPEAFQRGRFQLLRALPELSSERDITHAAISRANALVRLEGAALQPLRRYETALRALVVSRGGTVESLLGVQRPRSYTSYAMAQYAYAPALPPGPGSRLPIGVVTPLNKTAEWWAMPWMRRESFFLPRYDEQGRMVAKGHALAAEAGIPCLTRRLYHAPERYGRPDGYDFVGYFEFAAADAATFRAVMAALREAAHNPEWAYVREGPEWWGRRVAHAAGLWEEREGRSPVVALHGAASLEIPGGQPAEQGPDQTYRPARQHIGGIVHAEVDPTGPHQDRERHHDAEKVGLQERTGLESGQQHAEGEVGRCRQDGMAAGETRAADPDTRHRIGAPAGEKRFQELAEQTAAGRRGDHEAGGAILALQQEIADDGRGHQGHHHGAAQGGDIAADLHEPAGSPRPLRIGWVAERLEKPPIESLRIPLDHLTRQLEEHPGADDHHQGDEQHPDQFVLGHLAELVAPPRIGGRLVAPRPHGSPPVPHMARRRSGGAASPCACPLVRDTLQEPA